DVAGQEIVERLADDGAGGADGLVGERGRADFGDVGVGAGALGGEAVEGAGGEGLVGGAAAGGGRTGGGAGAPRDRGHWGGAARDQVAPAVVAGGDGPDVAAGVGAHGAGVLALDLPPPVGRVDQLDAVGRVRFRERRNHWPPFISARACRPPGERTTVAS